MTGDTQTHTWDFSYDSTPYLTSWWSPDNSAGESPAEATQITYSGTYPTSVSEPERSSCQLSGGTVGSCSPKTSFSWPNANTALVQDANWNAGLSNGNQTLERYVNGALVEKVEGYGFTSSGAPEEASSVTYELNDPFTLLPTMSFDGDGNETQDTYDSSGNVMSETDPLGNTTSYVYNAFDEVVQETDPLGNVTSYTYDSHGNELTETDPMGSVTTNHYNSLGELCATLSPNGNAAGDALTGCPTGTPPPYTTLYGYDGSGDVTSTTTPDDEVTTSLYNPAGEVCASLSPDGYAAGESLPASCPTVAGSNETIDTAFVVGGNALSSLAPSNSSGGSTTNTYDAAGNELTTNTGGDVVTNTYDADGNLCWTEDATVTGATCSNPPTGAGTTTTTNSYDPDGNQVSTVGPSGNLTPSLACLFTTTTSYDNLGDTTSTATPTGGTSCSNETTSTTTSTYDQAGNLMSSVTGGVVSSYTYDGDGNELTSDVGGIKTTNTYDAAGDELTSTTGSGSPTSTTTTAYNPDGNVCWTAPAAEASSACDLVPSTPGTLSYTYDSDGNELTVDNGGVITTNTYNEDNQVSTTTTGSQPSTSYSYDANGAVSSTTFSGQDPTDTYNGAGQLIEETYTDSTPTVSFQWGSNGKRCWMLQGGDSQDSCSSPPTPTTSETLTTYGYDSYGDLTSEVTSDDSGVVTTITYGYSQPGQLDCMSYPNPSGDTCQAPGSGQGIVTYSYNGSGAVTAMSDWEGNTFHFLYNSAGQLCWMSTYLPSDPSCSSPPSAAGAVTTADTYDPTSGLLSGIATMSGASAANLLSFSVDSRDSQGSITKETPTVGTTTETPDQYGYNTADQVSSGPITGSSSQNTYAYSSSGGITTDTTGFQSAAYSSSGELCWTYSSASSASCTAPPSGATTYSYNGEGQRTGMTPASGNPESYGWEPDSGLLSCVNTDGTSCSTSNPSSTTTTYTYDGNGLRSSATTDGTTTSFTWGQFAGNPALLSDGTWDFLYLPGSASPMEQIGVGSSTADELLSDASGNTRGIVQLSAGASQGQLVNYTDYDAYGNPITASDGSTEAGGLSQPQTGLNASFLATTPWGYGEGYQDATGLVYLIARYYDPTSASFLSIDPEVSRTHQAYEYANDNPVTMSDPEGRDPCSSSCWVSRVDALKQRLHTDWHGSHFTVDDNPINEYVKLTIARQATYDLRVFADSAWAAVVSPPLIAGVLVGLVCGIAVAGATVFVSAVIGVACAVYSSVESTFAIDSLDSTHRVRHGRYGCWAIKFHANDVLPLESGLVFSDDRGSACAGRVVNQWQY